MIVEDFALVLRRRPPWEALELGLVVARRWRKVALQTWLATYGVAGMVASCAVFWDIRYGWLLMWWLKPLFDRVLLSVYSRVVFGVEPTVGETLRATAGFLRSGQLWADLTYRRFSVVRSFSLPVTQLEGQVGSARLARLRLLLRSTQGCAGWLTFLCGNFVALLVITLEAALAILNPGNTGPPRGLTGFFAPLAVNPLAAWTSFLVLLVAETLIEPVYVASGFMLYLNRRSELEGWDLELAFRRLERRLSDRTVLVFSSLGSSLIAAGVLAGLMLSPGVSRAATASHAPLQVPLQAPLQAAPRAPYLAPTHTQPPAAAQLTPPVLIVNAQTGGALDEAEATARRIVKDPVFGHDEVEYHWQARNEPAAKEPTNWPAWLNGILALIMRLSEVVALLLTWGLRLALVLVLVLAIILVVRWNWRRRGTKPPGEQSAPPETLFGLDVRAEKLPSDVGLAAAGLLARGQAAAALALLYRACLVALIHRVRVRLAEGDTEARCLALAAGKIPPPSLDYFSRVVSAWQLTAYAHRPPPTESLSALCEQWSRHFGPAVVLQDPSR